MWGCSSRVTGAHRWSWFIHNGDDIGKLFVCHKCDNRKCVNPDHLFLGTHKENMMDMLSKGKTNRIWRNLPCKR
jgi:hypothetical protein